MRENNRKPIEKCIRKLPQFTTMNVIDGQAGLVIYSSLIFYSLTIDNILNIIVLLILAGISIGAITGNNGIIGGAQDAKEETEISQEKEIVELSSVQAMGKNNRGRITKENLQESLEKNAKNKTNVYTLDEENLIVEFKKSKRVYNVDSEGNVKEEDSNILVSDTTPGEFEGSGTETDPFIIMSIEDLVYLAETTKEDSKNYNGQYIKFGKSLNFESELSYADYQTTEYNDFLGVENSIGLMEALANEEYSGFNPLGSFEGTLDGDGKSLKNMYINKAGNAGLIEEMQNGTVNNLAITWKRICTGNYAGSISANDGTVSNCISRVNIEATGNYIAGIIGGEGNHRNIINCENYGNIKGNNYVGGINAIWGTVVNSKNYGNIIGSSIIGGRYVSAENCQNYGEIGNSTTTTAGGIIGQTTTGFVNKCINYGIVNAKSSAGGIAGIPMNATIMNCINMADVKVESEKAGGIAGYANDFETIINCYNYGNIS